MAAESGRIMLIKRGTSSNTGTAQAGAAGTITLAAGASAVDDFYNGMVIYLSAGTGAGQWRKITDYNGTTKVATISPNWTVTPNSTSVYTVYSIANVVAGVRTKTVTINKEPVDVTTDDSDGWRELLARPATRSVDISVEGVTQDDDLRAVMLGSETSHILDVVACEYADGSLIIGKFQFTSLEDSGEYTDAVQFSASLQSSGPVTFVPAP